MTKEPRVISTQIPANQSISGGVDIGDAEYIAIEIPDNATINTVTFQAKTNMKFDDEVTSPEDWDNVYDDTGTEVSVTVAANRVVVLGTVTKAALAACRFIRLRSGTNAAPVNVNPGLNLRLIVK